MPATRLKAKTACLKPLEPPARPLAQQRLPTSSKRETTHFSKRGGTIAGCSQTMQHLLVPVQLASLLFRTPFGALLQA